MRACVRRQVGEHPRPEPFDLVLQSPVGLGTGGDAVQGPRRPQEVMGVRERPAAALTTDDDLDPLKGGGGAWGVQEWSPFGPGREVTPIPPAQDVRDWIGSPSGRHRPPRFEVLQCQGMPLSLYLHIPFCTVRCSYCDFNTYAGLETLIGPYARALAAEVRHVGAGRPEDFDGRVHTVFFGGGTPSLLTVEQLAIVMEAVRESFEVLPDAEVTLEANPGTVDPKSLAGYRGLGVNRLSFGVQSAQPSELRLLDRLHTFGQVVEAVAWARQAGFDNLNLDLIYGLPHQSLPAWKDTVERTLALGPDHLSLYALTLEFGTPMQVWVERGLLPEPDSDEAADMYEWAGETLWDSGFAQYEISNWAKLLPGEAASETAPLRACLHNLQYWRNLPYLGLGAGAHGFAAGWRYSVTRSPRAYLQRMAGTTAPLFPFSPAVEGTHPVSPDVEVGETMMLGMRLTGEGVGEEDFQRRFGQPLKERYSTEILRLSELGLIERTGGRVRLTRRGRLLGNQVFTAFL